MHYLTLRNIQIPWIHKTRDIIIANFTKLSLIKLLFYLYMLVENKKNYINHVMQK